jgi:hypothetical protein
MVAPIARSHTTKVEMTFSRKTTAILTDSHLLIAVVVFCIGLALLVTLH